MCRNGHDLLPLLTDVCRDDLEVLALAVLRFVAAGYMTCDVACWDAAHDGAEQVLGTIDGPRLVAAMTSIMRAVRKEKRSDWHFMPATCCRVTEDEDRLVRLVGLAREGRRSELEIDAAALMGTDAAPLLCASICVAAEMLSALQPQLRSAATGGAAAVLH